MTEIKIDEQYSLFFRLQKGDKVLVELHDFHNLMMYRDFVSKDEFQAMKSRPGDFI